MPARINVGDRAPDFSLPDQNGVMNTLSDLLARGSLVLYFYPKDETPGCTAQACTFRAQHDDFVKAGATVVGISSDDTARHRAFADKHGLPFRLLSDESGNVRAAYGVPSTLGIMPGRVTYVVDAAGFVRHIFSSQFRAWAHVEEALVALRSMAEKNGSTG